MSPGRQNSDGFIPPHGGYEELLSYQRAVIGYDGTVRFGERFLSKRDRTVDQMVQAARSGKQNISAFRHFFDPRPPDVVANILICLIHQTNTLLDQQIRRLEKAFLQTGGLREGMTRARLNRRDQQRRKRT